MSAIWISAKTQMQIQNEEMNLFQNKMHTLTSPFSVNKIFAAAKAKTRAII